MWRKTSDSGLVLECYILRRLLREARKGFSFELPHITLSLL